MSSAVRISVLGPMAVTVDGVPVDIGPRRQRAVLARLVLAAGHVVSTDRLIEDLWDAEPPPKALAALQVHVSNLRRVLEPNRRPRSPAQILVSEPPGYSLRLPPEAVDAWEFEQLLSAATSSSDPSGRRRLLTQALSCWRGDAFGAVSAAQWAQANVARLDELRLSTVEHLAAADLADGHPDAVVATLMAHTAQHPEREEASRLLALAHYRSGRQADALDTLRRVRHYLADELGVDPSPALRDLESAILNHRVPTQASPPMTAPTPPAEHVPPDPLTTSPETVTARSSELHTIAGHADKAAAGALQIVWITAEAGAGKSTLAAAATAALRAQGWVVALGHCPEVDGAPSAWAWREVLGDDQPASSAGGDSFAVAQAVARKFSAGRTIVVLDDLHRADSATLQILRQVCSWLADRPVFILGGYRPSEADVELKGTVTALLAHTAQSIELGGLSDNGIQTVCAQAGLDALDEPTLQLIRQRTDGNPLFVRELAKLIVSRGVTEARVTVPAGIIDVIARRMARLPSEAGRLLRLAAVCGQHTNIDTLLGLWGDSEDTLLDAIDTTEVAGLITSDHTGRIGFSHILVRECAYSQIPRLRRARMHWQTLLALESQARPDPDELAHHSALGATPATADHALTYVRAAAERRLQAGAHADVAPLWQSVVDLEQMAGYASALATSHQRAGHLESLCHLVTALAYAGDLLQARQVRSRALDVAETDGRIDLIHRALTAWRAPTIWSNRDERRADDRMAHTLRRYLPGSDGHARVWLLITTVLEVEGIESAHAYDAAAQALALARDLDDPELLCAALNTQMFMALGPDLVDALPGWTNELENVAERAGLIAYQAVAHYFRFLIACSHTDLPEAATQVTLALEYASGGQVGQLAVVLSAYTAVLSVLAGDLNAAGRGYGELSTRMIAAGLPNGEAMALIGHLILGWHRGSIGHLTKPLAALYPVVPQMITWPYVLALLDAGHHDRAEQVADDAIAVSRDYYWTTMSAFHARALVRLGRVEHARTLYANLAPFSGMVAGLNSGTAVLGPIDDLLADLADLIGEPDAAAHHRARAVDTRTRVEDGLTALTAR